MLIIVGSGGMGFYLALSLIPEYKIIIFDDDDMQKMRDRLILPSTFSETSKKVEVLAYLDTRIKYVKTKVSLEAIKANQNKKIRAIVDATDLPSKDRNEIVRIAKEIKAEYIRASYNYYAPENKIIVSVSKGPGFEVNPQYGYNSWPNRRVAMLAGSWAANIIYYYLCNCIKLPQIQTFSFSLLNNEMNSQN
jgi:hypothetical protein